MSVMPGPSPPPTPPWMPTSVALPEGNNQIHQLRTSQVRCCHLFAQTTACQQPPTLPPIHAATAAGNRAAALCPRLNHHTTARPTATHLALARPGSASSVLQRLCAIHTPTTTHACLHAARAAGTIHGGHL